jgi:hypothetical protein
LQVQPIEYVGGDNARIRRFREDYWMKELRTVYPYGLNERSYEGNSKSITLFIIYSINSKEAITKSNQKTTLSILYQMMMTQQL